MRRASRRSDRGCPGTCSALFPATISTRTVTSGLHLQHQDPGRVHAEVTNIEGPTPDMHCAAHRRRVDHHFVLVRLRDPSERQIATDHDVAARRSPSRDRVEATDDRRVAAGLDPSLQLPVLKPLPDLSVETGNSRCPGCRSTLIRPSSIAALASPRDRRPRVWIGCRFDGRRSRHGTESARSGIGSRVVTSHEF